MSKQAWRFVLKKEQKHKRKKKEREKDRVGKRQKEEKVRGTAQESFNHEAQKTNKNNANHQIQLRTVQ